MEKESSESVFRATPRYPLSKKARPSPGTQALFRAIGLQKSFGERQLFKSMDIAIEPGEILAITGTNGSGKTTLIDIFSGYVTADAGDLRLYGRCISKEPPERIAALGIRRTFQQVRLAPDLDIKDHIRIASSVSCLSPIQALLAEIWKGKPTPHLPPRAEELLATAEVECASTRLPQQLSFGQSKILSLVCATAASPKLLLLDEPTAGLSPRLLKLVENYLSEIASEGVAIIIVEHNTAMIARIATRQIQLLPD